MKSFRTCRVGKNVRFEELKKRWKLSEFFRCKKIAKASLYNYSLTKIHSMFSPSHNFSCIIFHTVYDFYTVRRLHAFDFLPLYCMSSHLLRASVPEASIMRYSDKLFPLYCCTLELPASVSCRPGFTPRDTEAMAFVALVLALVPL